MIYDADTWSWYLPYDLKIQDRVEVLIGARQIYPPLELGAGTRFAIEPKIGDPAKNTLATLRAGSGTEEYDYSFRYAFFAAMEGRYYVVIENLARNEIKTQFIVKWRVYPHAQPIPAGGYGGSGQVTLPQA